jgi:hypothetical protein
MTNNPIGMACRELCSKLFEFESLDDIFLMANKNFSVRMLHFFYCVIVTA